MDEADARRTSQLRQSSDAETKTLVRNKQARADVADAAGPAGPDPRGGRRRRPPRRRARRPSGSTPPSAALDAYQDIQAEVVGKVIAETGDQAASAQQAVRLYVLGALAATLLAVLLAVIVGRATTGPLRKLTEAADRLSTERLPRLVEELKAPGGSDEAVRMELEPIEIRSTDEIGQLAERVQRDAGGDRRGGRGAGRAAPQGHRRHLRQPGPPQPDPARPPDRVHRRARGATRRTPTSSRTCSSSTTSPPGCGATLSRCWCWPAPSRPAAVAGPVALADVVRVAVGEVEDFTRIEPARPRRGDLVGGNVAVDLAHLLSELMENATHFSPPDTRVEVVGHRTQDDGYVISVSDHGIGMSAEQLAEANELLAKPPLVGLALSRSLGFIVIGRLAGALRHRRADDAVARWWRHGARRRCPPDLVADARRGHRRGRRAGAEARRPAPPTPPATHRFAPGRLRTDRAAGAGLPMREPVGAGSTRPAGPPPAAPAPPPPARPRRRPSVTPGPSAPAPAPSRSTPSP